MSAASDVPSWRPEILDARDVAALARIAALREDPLVVVHDAIDDQLSELVASLAPDRPMSDADRDARVAAHLDGVSKTDYGRWVYYPWSRRLVHLLPPGEYFFLRTDRNHHKITPEEQKALRHKTIGVVGLSVGQATALTLAMEGVGGRFKLADFDALSLSNMNRLRAGAHNIGVRKVVLAAREIFEIDPYVDIEIFPEGLSEDVLDRFFLEPRLDLLVEECDDLAMKVRAREFARAHRIPVVMETSDRGMLDVERFDLEPERPLLHGLVGDLDASTLRAMSTMEKIPYVMRILDDARMSAGIAASILEVKRTISTWPQLASAVALGGAVVTDVARRIFLRRFEGSGRFYVDIEELVGRGRPVEPSRGPIVPELAAPAQSPEPRRRRLQGRGSLAGDSLSPDEIRLLVHYATLAPSRANAQPWRFTWTGSALEGWLEGDAASPVSGAGTRAAAYVALGAAAFNLEAAARGLEMTAHIEVFPDGGAGGTRIFSATFAREAPTSAASVEGASLDLLENRATNRRIGERRRLEQGDREALVAAARHAGGELVLVEDDEALTRMADLLGAAERARHLVPSLHRARAASLRWTGRDAEATRTGIDVATLEIDAIRLALLRLASRSDVMETIRAVDGGGAFAAAARAEVMTSSAIAVLRVEGDGPRAHFAGGRAMQAAWIAATAAGLGVQPYDVTMLADELEIADADPPLARRIRAEIGALVGSHRAETNRSHIDEPSETETEGERRRERKAVVVFRVAYLPPPTARSLRRATDDVLEIAAASPTTARR